MRSFTVALVLVLLIPLAGADNTPELPPPRIPGPEDVKPCPEYPYHTVDGSCQPRPLSPDDLEIPDEIEPLLTLQLP